ncbi:MAG: hypothetical protein VKL39_03400 [Leptolyngbyaceae bacterium]|nr:hypothetical protein [Leptolyngbyaceae bacterium]
MSNNPRVETDNYDPHIVPAETAARKEREKEGYKQVQEESEQSIDTTGGYTVDQEGLANNYAIEPEMYINEPGDLRERDEREKAERAEVLQKANQTDESGKLSIESDERGKGVGKV